MIGEDGCIVNSENDKTTIYESGSVGRPVCIKKIKSMDDVKNNIIIDVNFYNDVCRKGGVNELQCRDKYIDLIYLTIIDFYQYYRNHDTEFIVEGLNPHECLRDIFIRANSAYLDYLVILFERFKKENPSPKIKFVHQVLFTLQDLKNRNQVKHGGINDALLKAVDLEINK